MVRETVLEVVLGMSIWTTPGTIGPCSHWRYLCPVQQKRASSASSPCAFTPGWRDPSRTYSPRYFCWEGQTSFTCSCTYTWLPILLLLARDLIDFGVPIMRSSGTGSLMLNLIRVMLLLFVDGMSTTSIIKICFSGLMKNKIAKLSFKIINWKWKWLSLMRCIGGVGCFPICLVLTQLGLRASAGIAGAIGAPIVIVGHDHWDANAKVSVSRMVQQLAVGGWY